MIKKCPRCAKSVEKDSAHTCVRAKKELPGCLEHAIAVSEGKWPHTMDAVEWTRAFFEAVKLEPDIPFDEEAMLGWFANAIMAGYDQANHATMEQRRKDFEAGLMAGGYEGCAPPPDHPWNMFDDYIAKARGE